MNVSRERLGLLYMLVGPGGVGKNALLNYAVDHLDNLRQLPTATTRSPRPGEEHGHQRLFLTRAKFEHMIATNQLIEHQLVHGNEYYGVPRAIVEDAITNRKDLIADIEYKGARIIRAKYPRNSTTVFVAPPSFETLKQRLYNRNDSEQEVLHRLERATTELFYMPESDYVIINDTLSLACDELIRIIRAERGQVELDAAGYPLNRIEYSVVVRLENDGQILNPANGTLLTGGLIQGQNAATIALKLVGDGLGVNVDQEALEQCLPGEVNPAVIEFDRDAQIYSITYNYVYHLSERIAAPDGWSWQAL